LNFKEAIKTRRRINDAVRNMSEVLDIETIEELKRILFNNEESRASVLTATRIFSVIFIAITILSVTLMLFTNQSNLTLIICLSVFFLTTIFFVANIATKLLNSINGVELYLNTLQQQIFEVSENSEE